MTGTVDTVDCRLSTVDPFAEKLALFFKIRVVKPP